MPAAVAIPGTGTKSPAVCSNFRLCSPIRMAVEASETAIDGSSRDKSDMSKPALAIVGFQNAGRRVYGRKVKTESCLCSSTEAKLMMNRLLMTTMAITLVREEDERRTERISGRCTLLSQLL